MIRLLGRLARGFCKNMEEDKTIKTLTAKEMKNLRADAEAGRVYYIAECMGRKAGWLSYGVGIAGEANMVFSVEDVDEEMELEEAA